MKSKARPTSTLSRRVAAKPRLIESDADVKAAIKVLRRQCGVIRRIHDLAGDPPLRRRPGGFDGLARIIIGQQVSVASATAIWSRFEGVAKPMTAKRVAALTDDDMRAAGLSRPKMRTLRAVAQAVLDGFDFAALATKDEDAAREALTSISGIGPWTADVYLMFCIGRMDVFAPGDLALQVAAQLAFELDERPDAKTLASLAAERWTPYRGVAARMLWHYYAHVKAQKNAQPA